MLTPVPAPATRKLTVVRRPPSHARRMDVLRIQLAFYVGANQFLTEHDAELAWLDFSATLNSTWMPLPHDGRDIITVLSPFITFKE